MKRVVLLALSLLALPSASSADPIQMNWTGTGKGMGVNVTGLGWVFAGELAWKFDGVDILTYCVDIANTLGNPQTVYVESISNLTGQVPTAVRRSRGFTTATPVPLIRVTCWPLRSRWQSGKSSAATRSHCHLFPRQSDLSLWSS